MKKQILILEVKFDEEEREPSYWDWNRLIGCEDCVKLLNHGASEKENNEQD